MYKKEKNITQNKKLIIFLAITTIIFTVINNEVYAEEENVTKITVEDDLYIKSSTPIQVAFEIKATDEFDNMVPVNCDKTPNSVFELGKTTVRCIAIDSLGNEVRDSFEVTVGYDIVHIPDWFKQTTEFWITEKISEREYVKTLDYLLEEQLMKIPTSKSSNKSANSSIPIWIETNSEKWVNNEITNDEFSIAIQWIVEHKLEQT